MKPQAAFAVVALSMFGTSTTPAQANDKLVEVKLVSSLDEPRGYCLDIAGGKGKRAPLDKGLQAHTCYNYTGKILEDQGFDPALVSKGLFRVTYFNVCMAVPAVKVGAAISLGTCKDAKTQKFVLKANGQLAPESNPNLCVTVDGTKKREGRGGIPIHVMRPLSLQNCDASKKAYQTWALNKL